MALSSDPVLLLLQNFGGCLAGRQSKTVPVILTVMSSEANFAHPSTQFWAAPPLPSTSGMDFTKGYDQRPGWPASSAQQADAWISGIWHPGNACRATIYPGGLAGIVAPWWTLVLRVGIPMLMSLLHLGIFSIWPPRIKFG